MIRKAVVLCGGLATRFLPYCKSVPKEMLPLADKPLIQYIVEDLVDAGITDIMIILGRNKECLVNHFDRNIELEDRLKATNKLKELELIKKPENLANITFRRQIIPRGTGHAVDSAKDWVADEPFLMCFGDEMFVGGNAYKQLIEEYNNSERMVIATMPVNKKEISLYGIVDGYSGDTYFKINQFVEKPTADQAPSNLAYAGPAVLDKTIFEYIARCPEINYEVSLADAYNLAIADSRLYGKIINAKKLDLGNKLGFVKANIYMAMQNPEFRDDIVEFVDNIK